MEEIFEETWQALYENGSSGRNKEPTRTFFASLSPSQQQTARDNIVRKVREGLFVQYDPIRAIRENIRRTKPRQQTLTMSQYYERYKTTAETDGWHQANPTGNQVIYIKQL